MRPGRSRVVVQEELPGDRGRSTLPRRPVGVEQDRPARVVLVVEEELAQPHRVVVVRVPRVGVGAEVQHVAGVVGVQPVDHVEAGAGGAGVEVRVVRREQRLGAGDRVVAGATVDEVVVPAAEDDVVGVVGVVGRLVDDLVRHRVGVLVGPEVVDRQVHGLGQDAVLVDRRGLDLSRRVDELVEHVALAGAGVRVADLEGEDAVQRLAVDRRRPDDPAVRRRAAGVAAGEDPSVVTEQGVDPGAAGHPVVAPAADQVVVLRVAVEDVVTDPGVGGVVTGLAVDLVLAADVDVVAVRALQGPDLAAGGLGG